ncbi:hypothetical protein ACG74X_08300 [Marivita sp. S0852]|uniref:hypothetical protein n=1 Tax=Marivita sp. S0852 TaxID=3373893 RepID=UPI003981D2C6
MYKKIWVLGMCLAVAGCGPLVMEPRTSGQTSDGQTRPTARPSERDVSARTPPPMARTVEEFDTTTAEERAAAASANTGAERALGSTIVSLGDPARPGFWIETPLVSSPDEGRVVYGETGQSSQVTLIPIDGPETGGSRMSLSAMRLIGVPLTGLVEVQVFTGG